MPPQNTNTVDTGEGRFATLWRYSRWFKPTILGLGGLIVIALIVGAFFVFGAKQAQAPQTTPPVSTPRTPTTTVPDDSEQTPSEDQPTTTPKEETKKTPSSTSTNSNSSNTSGSSNSTGGSSGSGDTGGSGVTCLPGLHVAGASDGAGGCWPGPNNTGVPAGTVLTTYSGPCLITTDGTIIDAKTVNCDLEIHAANVTIKNSKVNGIVFLDTDLSGSGGWSMTIQDTEVDAGTQQRAAVSVGNMTVIRANLHGGQTSAQCEETGSFCSITDSWLHGQYLPDDQPWHLGGFLSDGGVNMTLRHNTVVCDHAVNSVSEGCTGDINFIPNFAAISGALVEHNLLGANIGSSYCTYGGEKFSSPTPHSDHIIYKDNIFQRGTNNMCAAFGPVTNFDINQPGNQWINNRWEDGGLVDPAN